MKKVLITVIALAMLISSAFASLSYSVDVVSRYIFRGVDFGQNVNFEGEGEGTYNNSPAIQPGLEYSFGDSGVYAGIWSSIGLGDQSTQKLDELDPYIGYDFSVGDIDYTVGYTIYTLPSTVEYNSSALGTKKDAKTAAYYTDLYEYWAGFSLPKVALSPSLTYYYGFGNGRDSDYSNTELGLTLPSLPGDIGVGLTFEFYGYKGTRGDTTYLTDIVLGLSKDVKVAGVDATAYMNYIGIMSHPQKGLDNYVVNDEEDAYELVFGLSFGGDLL